MWEVVYRPKSDRQWWPAMNVRLYTKAAAEIIAREIMQDWDADGDSDKITGVREADNPHAPVTIVEIGR